MALQVLKSYSEDVGDNISKAKEHVEDIVVEGCRELSSGVVTLSNHISVKLTDCGTALSNLTESVDGEKVSGLVDDLKNYEKHLRSIFN